MMAPLKTTQSVPNRVALNETIAEACIVATKLQVGGETRDLRDATSFIDHKGRNKTFISENSFASMRYIANGYCERTIGIRTWKVLALLNGIQAEDSCDKVFD